MRLLLGEPQDLEHLLLQLAAMNPDAAPTDLPSVTDDIVGLSPHLARIRIQERYILLHGRGEGVMHRVPTPFFLIPLQKGEVQYPGEGQDAVVPQAQPLGYLQAQIAQGLGHHLGAVGHHEDEVAHFRLRAGDDALYRRRRQELGDGRFRSLGHQGQRDQPFGPVLLGELGQLVQLAAGISGTAGGAEGFDPPPFGHRLAEDAELAFGHQVGDVHQGQAEAQVGLVAAVALHGLVI